MRRLLPFLFLLSSTCFANVTYWTPYGGYNGPRYSSPQAACEYVFNLLGYTLNSVQYMNQNGGQYNYACLGKTADGSDQRNEISGDGTCDSAHPFDSSTGMCSSPDDKCAATKGASAVYSWKSATESPASTISVGGCELETGTSLCRTSTKGYGYVCTGTVTSTGKALAANPKAETSFCTGDDCTKDQPQPQTSQDAPSCSTDSSGVSTCTSKSSSSNPGTANCTAGTCVENPKATSKDSTVTTTTQTTTNTDGTSTDATTSKNTTTSCIGAAGSCTTTSSVSKGSKTTDSKGNVISQSSTCSGSGCKSNGTSPSASESAEEGDDKGDDKFPAVKAPEKPTAGSFDGQEDAWDTKINTAKSDLKDALGDIKNSFSPVGDLTLAGGAKLYCPAPVPVPLLNITLSFCADEYADSLSWIGAAIYAVCAVIALFIVFG